ncbi:MAG: AI-2E family transporter [Candidatus Taylorbacteria bacterium]|nr:AI-2E family transporter [Candidatus Taylorbacteria bacterium]
MAHKHISSYFFFVLLLIAAVAAAMLFLPFITPLILGIAGAVLAYPVYRRLASFFGGGSMAQTLAALVTVVAVLLIILVPAFFLVGGIYSEIQTLYAILTDEGNRSDLINVLNTISQSLSNLVFGVLPQYSFDSFNLTEYIKSGLEVIFANLDRIFTSLATVGAYVVIFLMSIFYFLRDGVSLVKRFISWSPALESNEEYIMRTMKKTVQSVFFGTIVVSIIDGVSMGLAFTVFGIPAPALWGAMTAIAALIPGFGLALVALPGVVYLVIAGHYGFAIGLVIWAYATIFISDHLIGPLMVNRGVKVHQFLILLSVLGGVVTFGIVGFLIGPLILVFLFSLLEIYRNSVSKTQ